MYVATTLSRAYIEGDPTCGAAEDIEVMVHSIIGNLPVSIAIYATVCEVQASCELFNCSITVWLKTRVCSNKERQTYSDNYIRTSFSGNNIEKHLDVVLSGNHFQVMLFDETPPIHDTSDTATGPDASQQHDVVSVQKN